MKVSDLIREVRLLLNDVTKPYLWSDDELLSCYRDTLYDIQLATPISVLPYIDNVSLDEDIHLNLPQLLKYGTAYRAYMKQDSDIFDDKATAKLRQEYLERLSAYKQTVVRDSNDLITSSIFQGLL